MTPRAFLHRLWHAQSGAAVIEFGLLAPIFFMLLFGVFSLGLQLQNYNALRSAAADISRYTVVEYQKANKLGNSQIRDVAYARAAQPPYSLRSDRLDVEVIDEAAALEGAKKIKLTLSYDALDFLPDGVNAALRLTHDESIIVPTE